MEFVLPLPAPPSCQDAGRLILSGLGALKVLPALGSYSETQLHRGKGGQLRVDTGYKSGLPQKSPPALAKWENISHFLKLPSYTS